ncbi:MAG: TOBE domain-containing protein, partial [Spongiibacteraceae bacterium]|nr:TOBE domain-containing protein [Spongiibacteraceae bacterium]
EQPNCRYTAEFIGSVNIFEGVMDEDKADHCTILSPELDRPIRVGHGVTGFSEMPMALAVRPEKVALSKTQPAGEYNWSAGVVEDIAYLGTHSVYHVRLKTGKKVLAMLVNDVRWANERFTWDEPVWVHWDDNAGVVLTA